MVDTPNLGLPYILAAQSQKHVPHNEAIRALDAMVQLSVLDRSLTAPPATPAEGDRYIVASSPTGAWSGQAEKIAANQDGAWMFYAPKEGWISWVADENIAVAFDGAVWIALSAGGGGGGVTDHGALTGLGDDDHPQYHNNARGDARYSLLNPTTFGINATADTTNRLSVGSAASLFNHAGTGGHQIKVNKAAVADTASFLFQSAFSGRAEIGLTGDDDFHFKVSPNGTAFNEAIIINRTTGACSFPNTSFGGVTDGDKGDVSVSGAGAVWTVDADAVSNAKLANVPTATLKGRVTAATGDPEDLTVAQAKTLLNLVGTNTGDQTSIAGITGTLAQFNTACTDADFAIGGGTITGTSSGVNTGDQTITLTGNVTGSGTGSFAATIAANAVTNALLADVPTATFKGRTTVATGDPEDLTVAQAKTLLNLTGTNSGDQTSIVGITGTIAQFNTAITDGDLATGGGTATGANTGDNAVNTLYSALVTNASHTGEVNGSYVLTIAAGAVATAKIADNNVTLAKIEDAPAYTLLLRDAATTGDPAYVKISTLTDRTVFGAGDKLMIEESTGELRKIDYSDLPGSAGGILNGYATITDGVTSGTAVGGDTFKLRAGVGLSVTVQNNDATHGDNALYSMANMAAKSFKGNLTGAAAAPTDMTADDAATLITPGFMEYGNRRAPIFSSDFLAVATNLPNVWPFSSAVVSSGTVAQVLTTTIHHPGVAQISSSTTANSGGWVQGLALLIGGGETFNLVFKTPAAFTSTTLRLGFLDTTSSADAVDGCYFELVGSGVVVAKTASNSVRTTSATVATLVASTWYHARVKVNAAGTGVDFTLFDDAGAQLGTVNITTNIPTAAGRETQVGLTATNSGTTATALVQLDYMSFGIQGRTLVRGALN